jgi:hypothetical protein
MLHDSDSSPVVPCSTPHIEPAILYHIEAASVLVFVAKFGIKGAVPLLDRAGRAVPLLKHGTQEDLSDPFVLAERQKLQLKHGLSFSLLV